MVKKILKAQVSNYGRFKSIRGVISTPTPRTNGYVSVSINKKLHYIHRLIAIAFGLKCQPGQTQVNHKNRNPSDNRLSNLEWATPSDNMNHSFETNSDRKSSAPKRSKPVLGRKCGDGEENWTMYDSANDAARRLKLNQGHISACCNGRISQTGGYEFKFDAPNEVECLEGEVWRDVDLEL